MFLKKILFNTLFILNFTDLIKANELCNYYSHTLYQNLITQFPEHQNKFDVLSNIPLPIWVTEIGRAHV